MPLSHVLCASRAAPSRTALDAAADVLGAYSAATPTSSAEAAVHWGHGSLSLSNSPLADRLQLPRGLRSAE